MEETLFKIKGVQSKGTLSKVKNRGRKRGRT